MIIIVYPAMLDKFYIIINAIIHAHQELSQLMVVVMLVIHLVKNVMEQLIKIVLNAIQIMYYT